MPKEVVIIGGGFGGLKCAKSLCDQPVRVTVIDRQNHHVFQPLLYQVATAGLSPADIAWPIRSVLSRQRNARVLMAEVHDIDVDRRLVLHSEGTTSFDALVIATGATPSYLGRDDWAEVAPGLKTIDDATEIRSRILVALEQAELTEDLAERAALLTFVVVGAGPTGVEVAGAILELTRRAMACDFRSFDPADARVILVEAGPRVLANYPPKLSDAAVESLLRLGVEVRVGEKVLDIRPGLVQTDTGEIPAQVVVWAAGVKASPAAQWLGLKGDRAGRVPVDSRCRVMLDQKFDSAEVYAIGDVAFFPTEDGRGLPGLAPVAIQQGEFVARMVMEQQDLPFTYNDRGSLATIGRSRAVADLGRWELSGFFAWLIWLVVHLWQILGLRRKLSIFTTWA